MLKDQLSQGKERDSIQPVSSSSLVLDAQIFKNAKANNPDPTELKKDSRQNDTLAATRWKQRCIDVDMLRQMPSETEHLSFNRCWEGDMEEATWLSLFKLVMPIRNIKILWINYCCLTDIHITEISPFLDRVEQICLSRNNITDRGVQILARHLKSAELLNLSCNQITGVGATMIAVGLLQLKKFYVDGNTISTISKKNILALAPYGMVIGF